MLRRLFNWSSKHKNDTALEKMFKTVKEQLANKNENYIKNIVTATDDHYTLLTLKVNVTSLLINLSYNDDFSLILRLL